MDGITLLALPYDSGRFDERMGRGPLHLLKHGLAERLGAQNRPVEVVTVRLSEGFYSEGQALVALQNLALRSVRESLAQQRRALVLSGNCGPAALSAVSALNPRTTGVIWFDAHADFNTPDTSASGFLDGMSLSILTGRSWPALAARFIGFERVPEGNVILVGAREFDSLETAALGASVIRKIPATKMELIEEEVAALADRCENFYVHLDVDVLDEAEGRANSYACGGGLSAAQLFSALELLQPTGRIKVAGVTSYDPACDPNGSIRALVERAASLLAGS